MKYKVLSMMGVLALSAGAWVHAQDFDDIYYDGSSTTSTVKEDAKTAVVVRTPRRATTQLLAADYDVPARYKVSVEKNYKTERDVDEYNRRTGEYAYDAYADTLHGSNESQYTFSNTKRIERFYNPDVVVASSDADLIELYYDETPAQINITFGTSYPGWTTWYDPWYYHNTLWGLGYYDPWFWPYGYRYTWYGWHGPWYYSSWSWGWGRPYWGWSRPYWGWSRPYWGGWYGHHYRHDRPFGGGHHYGSGRPGYAYGGGSMGGRRPNSGRGTGSLRYRFGGQCGHTRCRPQHTRHHAQLQRFAALVDGFEPSGICNRFGGNAQQFIEQSRLRIAQPQLFAQSQFVGQPKLRRWRLQRWRWHPRWRRRWILGWRRSPSLSPCSLKPIIMNTSDF